jgi:molecular chaperone DnaK (HSP70)
MPGRLGVDFGTSNTVIAVWDETHHEGVPFHIPDYGKTLQYRQAGKTGASISLVPSLVHYAPDQTRWLGQQVVDHDLYSSPRTFRWMKRYIARRSPIKIRLDGRNLSPFEAGNDFLSAVLTSAAAELDVRDEEVAFTVPVEAFEDYANWLMGVAQRAGLARFRLLDEASAAALGYGIFIQPGDVYLIFDFGGGTLDVSMVLMEPDRELAAGRCCRVLGKAGLELGGATVDQWIYQEVLRQNGKDEADDDIRHLSRQLLTQCERVKEELSFVEKSSIELAYGSHAGVLKAEITRGQLEQLLDAHDAHARMDQTIRRALHNSAERGYTDEQIKAVLMVGGSSLIPSVQRTLMRIFGRERVRLQRPLDAVARGAAAFVAGVDFQDHIQHDYAIRYVNAQSSDYEYRPLITRGTPYPTREPVARLTVKASHDGQTQLGIAIFELSLPSQQDQSDPVELTFDVSGAARITRLAPEEEYRRTHFWINEKNPTFLPAEPPARRAEPRFEVEFGIDGNKRLLVTARDVLTKRLVYRDHPVVQLT